MKIYERYAVARTSRGILLAFCVFSALFGVVALIDEMSQVGKGSYSWRQACLFVVLTSPQRLLDLVPLAGFIGVVIGLGFMASTNELVALSAAGLSPWNLSLSALKAGLLLVVGGLVVAEFIAPPLTRSAETQRSFAIGEPSAVQTDTGFWFREGRSFVRIGPLLPGRRVADVVIYKFDDRGQLESRTTARQAQVLDSGRWILEQVEIQVLVSGELQSSSADTVRWTSNFGPSLLELTVLAIDSLSVSDLWLCVTSLDSRGEQSAPTRLRLWRILGLPFTVDSMIFLAVAFVHASAKARSATRLVLGGAIGGAVYAIDRIGGYAGLLSGIDPVAMALLPGIITLVVALLVAYRLNWFSTNTGRSSR